MTTLAENVDRVRARVAAAAEQSGRAAEDITLVAVTKRQPPAILVEALANGIVDIGENYVQEASEKRLHLETSDWGQIHWHLIGHLQSNKAKVAVELFDLIQSVDSLKLAQAIGRHAQSLRKVQKILLQIHLGDEAGKSGVLPEQAEETAREIGAVPGVALQGIMGIAPGNVPPRPYFQEMHRVFEALPLGQRQTLSMGMTGDFETAIEEGATMVRIGTALFGAREY